MSFIVTTKRIKCLWINLTKEVKDIVEWNWREQRNGKIFHAHWLKELTLQNVHKAIYRLNAILARIQMVFFTEIEQRKSLVCVEQQKTPKSPKKIWERGKSWRHHTSWFQTTLHNYSNQTVWYWQRNRYTDQWNRIENTNINIFLCD